LMCGLWRTAVDLGTAHS